MLRHLKIDWTGGIDGHPVAAGEIQEDADLPDTAISGEWKSSYGVRARHRDEQPAVVWTEYQAETADPQGSGLGSPQAGLADKEELQSQSVSSQER